MMATQLGRLMVMAQAGVLAGAACALPANAAGAKVYVADEDAGTVSVLDAASFKKVGSIAVGQGSHNVQVAPDGKLVWVTNNGQPVTAMGNAVNQHMGKSGHEAMTAVGEVWAIDTATDATSHRMAVSPSSRYPMKTRSPSLTRGHAKSFARSLSALYQSSCMRPLIRERRWSPTRACARSRATLSA